MKSLIITDLHLTDNPREDYRWDVFTFVEEYLDENYCENLLILGDIFDKKDKHSSEIVNRLVNELLELQHKFAFENIYILKGNHDYVVDESKPFLKFLGHFENIHWINEPSEVKFNNNLGNWYFLPHSRTPEADWEKLLPKINNPDLDFLFMHQSVIGSKVSNYHEMKEGLDPKFLKDVSATIVSGDIHVPQKLGKVIYLGTQHPVSFGDDYDPRMGVIEDNKLSFILINTIKRPHIKKEVNSFDDLKKDLQELTSNDQVRITLILEKNQLHEWAELRKQIQDYCKEALIDLHDLKLEVKQMDSEVNQDLKNYIKTNSNSMTSADILRKFAQAEGIDDDLFSIGSKLMTEEIR